MCLSYGLTVRQLQVFVDQVEVVLKDVLLTRWTGGIKRCFANQLSFAFLLFMIHRWRF